MATTSAATGLLILALATRTVMPLTQGYYLVFGILTIVGGIMGYVKAKSIVSIISGSICGIVLVAASILLLKQPEHPIREVVPALCVSVLLAGKFVPDFLHKKGFVPGGLMAILSVIGIVLSILALLPK
jgi:uncharacterized membrane protein (UPF0136 family)